MITERVRLQRKRVINVVYNTTAASTTKADDIQNTAAQVMSAILLCERGGLRVNLWSVIVTKKGSKYVAVAIKIKDSAQHIDLLKMAYPMTHPSMLRRHVFRAIETMPGVPSSFVGTYGECVFNDSEVELCMSAVGINADSIISFSRCWNMTREQIINEITKVNK